MGSKIQIAHILPKVYVYMSRSCTTEMSIIACLGFWKNAAKYRSHPLHYLHNNIRSLHVQTSQFLVKLNICYDSHFWYTVSVHIDVHSDRKRIVSISLPKTPFLTKPSTITLVIFSKMGSKIQISHTLPICTSICHVVAQQK